MSLFFMLKKKRRWFPPTPKFIEPNWDIYFAYLHDHRLSEIEVSFVRYVLSFA